MKHLYIPERYRKAKSGARTRCNKCGKNFTDKCGMSGKKIYTCKFPESHRFQSKIYDPVKRIMVHGQTWPKELRDFNKFWRLHLQLVASKESKVVMIEEKPGLLTDCIKMFAKHIKDIGVEDYEKKGNTEHYNRSQLRYLQNMRQALKAQEINPDFLAITEFGKQHVGIIDQYISAHYANKSYNHHLAVYRRLFKFLIEKNYPIGNPFTNVKMKPTKAKKEIISMEEFRKLCEAVTPTAGITFEDKKVKGQVKRVQRNWYRPYLIDGWELELYAATRFEEIETLRVKDVIFIDGKMDHIRAIDHKASKKKKEEVIRLIPMIDELRNLCERLIKGKGPEYYLIAPEETNRKKVSRYISAGFSHYWRLVSDRKGITFGVLKNTYSTEMYKRFGPKTNIHLDIGTTVNNYVNDLEVIREFNVKLYG